MLYHISRGGQTYGPYTLADLKRYVESGHVLRDDLVRNDDKTDETAEWMPVAHVLDPSGVPPVAPPTPSAEPVYATAFAPQHGYAPVALFQDPPNLHWGLVLLFDVLTAKLFQMVWNLVLSAWMRRIQPNSKALFYYAAGYLLGLVYTIMYLPMVLDRVRHIMANDLDFRPRVAHAGVMFLIALGGWVCRLLARLDMKRSLEEHFNTVEPMGFRMSGVMTFFFGGLYIQAQLNRINERKRAMRYTEYIP